MKRQTAKSRISVLVLILLTGCAYFNTFYNAQIYYDSAIADLEKNGRTRDGRLPSKAQADFLTAIEKCQKVIENYPHSRHIEEAFFILGRSYYFSQKDGLSERYLNQLLVDYPDSPREDEIRVWLARLHAQMGMYDQMDRDLEPVILKDAPDLDRLTEIYMLKGDIAIERNNKQLGMEHYVAAALTASSAATKADIYYQLYTMTEADSNYEASLNFLNEFTKVTPNRDEQLEGRLTKVKLLQKLGKLEKAYLEIKAMEGLTEFAKLIPGMRIQLANIEVGRGNYTTAVEMYMEIQENFPSDAAASDAAFLLAKIYITEQNNIKRAQGQLRKVKKNTLYYSEATSNLKQLTDMDKLNDKIVKLSTAIGVDSGFESSERLDKQEREDFKAREGEEQGGELRPAGKSSNPRKLVDETPGETINMAKIDTVEIDTAGIREELAYAKYRLAEMTIFELLQVESGLDMMSEIIFNFDQTSVAPQAAYLLFYHSQADSTQNEFWRSLLLERYPNSQYAKLLADKDQLEIATDAVLDSLIENAYESLDEDNPVAALEFFKTIRKTYNTDKASFAVGYLNDEYLNELDGAIVAYEEYLTLFPNGEQIDFVADRLEQLRTIKIDSNGVPRQNSDNK
ncbi:tetratricopeptide repeat protein [Candidatus Neomarinimicrobiota bacterium]